jgi:hypothetical protein
MQHMYQLLPDGQLVQKNPSFAGLPETTQES